MTLEDLKSVATGLVGAIAPDPESFEYVYLESVLVTPIQNGIQVHRICAGCQDVASQVQQDTEAAAVFESFCGPENYGAVNATFSGLMMVPLADDDETILPGTLKGVIEMHPTSTALVPSLMWTRPQSTEESTAIGDGGPEEEFMLQLDAILAGSGQVLVFPDYMGYAENGNELFKGYTIRKAYETSCVPIVLFAQEYLRQQTNSCTELSTTVAVKGYSEGGYTAVVLADVLHRLGWNILQVHAGGGPYDLIAATTKTFERIVNGQYDMRFRHILALVGSSYSSTYMDLPNYRQNQDMLTDVIRPTLVNLIANSTPGPIVRESMPYDDQSDLLDLLFEENYLAFVDASVAAGEFDPCGNTSREELERLNVDKICQAFQLNVIVETLQNAPFRVSVCHSEDDEVVPFASVPDLSGNNNLTFVPAQGTHNEAGAACIFGALLYYFGQEFQSVAVDPVHSNTNCAAVDAPGTTPIETSIPTNQSPTFTPSEEVGDTTTTTNAPTETTTASGTSGGITLVASCTWMTFIIVSVAAILLVHA
ncbi:hypothetical protein IV203_007051 [Nitzschia inconspicua]|uniref:Uncharacterized protein n=1 Tax=Nitzschia inconspicua TaxID=303405 RepID=A0A9K3KDY9_9STRA|nr:hypothetical protein IV203_007051 [Nitzschia inconspicua]